MTERPPFRPRAMTPMESFDSRPKFPVADPFEGIPRLRPPSNMGELGAKIERELRDTDRISVSMRQEEETPTETPFSIRVMQRFDKFETELAEVKGLCSHAANNTLQVLSAINTVNAEVAALKRRMTAFELADRWVPRLAWLVTTAIAVFALLRTYR